jgi:CelD/BcsL family acetyltransferase involved in cellulose biosynthesis
VALPDLIEEFKISRATAYGIVKRLGLPGRRSALGAEDVEKAARLYQSGESLLSVGEHFGVAAHTEPAWV